MKRKIVLATVLCLAVATLGIWAAPALAADGCTCHTAVPPTATAAHAPFVASVTNCATCHVGMTVPHSALGVQVLSFWTTDASGLRLAGQLGGPARWPNRLRPHPDAAVYLQQRLWGATAFADLTQVTTDAKGEFAFTIVAPSAFAAYRAVAAGWVGPVHTFKPRATTLLPTPELTLTLHARFRYAHTPLTPRPVSLKLGRSVTVSGTVKPTDLGGKVTIRVKKLVAGKWFPRIRVKRAISATGSYRWKFTPKSRGSFRVHAAIPATAVHSGVRIDCQLNGYGWFKVI